MFVTYINPFSLFTCLVAEIFFFISLLIIVYFFYSKRLFFKRDLLLILAITFMLVVGGFLFMISVHSSVFFGENPLQLFTTQLELFSKVYNYSFSIVFSKLLVLFFSFFILYFYEDSDNVRFSKISLLILWLDFFILILFGLSNFIYIFFVLEIIAIISVVLILVGSTSRATYNALLYFFLNVVFGGLFLLGLWFLYSFYHRFDFDGIIPLIGMNKLPVSIGFLFICFVFFFKLGASPFHFWTLDVYEKLLLPVFLVFNVVLKIAIFIVFVKLVVLFNLMTNYTIFVTFILVAFLSLLFGIISPLVETRFFRVMLFSSLYILGFSILPLIASTPGSYTLSVHFFFSYIAVFFFFFTQISPLLVSYKSLNLTYNTDFGVLLKKTKYPIGLLYLTFFTMSAIPPLLMFWYKAVLFMIFASLFNFYFLIFLLLLSSISTFIYFRFVKLMATDFLLKDFLHLFHVGKNFFNFITFVFLFFFPYIITYFVVVFSIGLPY